MHTCSIANSFVQEEEGGEFKEGEEAVQDEPMGEESQATTTGKGNPPKKWQPQKQVKKTGNHNKQPLTP